MIPQVQLQPLAVHTIHQDFSLITKNETYLEIFGEGYPDLKNANDYFRYLLGMYGDFEAISMKRFTITYNQERVGQVGLHSFQIQNFTPQAEIFYWIDQQFQGKGIVTQAVKLLENHAFEILEVELLLIHCLVSNEKSANVAKRCNFQYQGLVKLFNRDCGCKIEYHRFEKNVQQYQNEKREKKIQNQQILAQNMKKK